MKLIVIMICKAEEIPVDTNELKKLENEFNRYFPEFDFDEFVNVDYNLLGLGTKIGLKFFTNLRQV